MGERLAVNTPVQGTAADLIKASTQYEHRRDFDNFGLGLPAQDKESTFDRSDLLSMFTDGESGGTMHVMGIDVGHTYHLLVGSITPGEEEPRIVHAEKIKMGAFKDRYLALKRRFRPVCSVIDSGPHGETVLALQGLDPTLYASVYIRSKSMLTYRVLDDEGDEEVAREFLRQVNVNRNRAFDLYMSAARGGGYTVDPRAFGGDEELKEEFISHHLSMKRARIYDNDSGELSFNWTKTDGKDHFHHAGLYLTIAAKIRGVVQTSSPFNPFEMMRMRLKT